MVTSQVKELLQSFETDSKAPKRKYKDFLAYIYMIYDKQISLCRSDSIKNKYIKERNGVLEYIAKNRKVIQKQFGK